MAKFIGLQTDFTAGELSPRLKARVDVEKYAKGLETCTNAKITPHGPLLRRGGFRYVNEVRDSSVKSRLIPFQVSEDDSVILEFSDQVIRFYAHTSAGEPGVITSGGSEVELVSPYLEAELPDLQYVQLGAQLYIAHPSYEPRIITRLSSTSWIIENLAALPPPTIQDGDTPNTTLTLGATSGSSVTFTAGAATFADNDIGRTISIITSTGGVGRATITGYTSTTVVTCRITSTFDTTSYSADEWKLNGTPVVDVTPDGSLAGSIITISADDSAVTWRSGDVGKYILLHNGVAKILALSGSPSGSDVLCEVMTSLDSEESTAVWTLESEAWSATRGYPRSIALYQQRLFFGGTSSQPQTIWASEVGLFDAFGAGALDSNGLDIEILGEQANTIEVLSPSRELFIGTIGNESTLSGGSQANITSSSVDQRPRTFYGVAHRPVVKIGSEIVFLQRSREKLRSFRYDFNIDGYIGDDLTFLAEHMASGGIDQMAFSEEPDSIIWAVKDDGDLLACTYRRDLEVLGWSRFTTDGEFESCATIDHQNEDQLWVIVKRTINGQTKRYIEVYRQESGTDAAHAFSDSHLVLSNPITISSISKANPAVVTTSTAHGLSNGDLVILKDITSMTEVDNRSFTIANVTSDTFELSGENSTSYTTFSGTGTVFEKVTSVSGLDHLEGKTVQVKVDNASHPDKVVSSGSITLEQSAGEVVVGLPYTTTITTLNLTGNQPGLLQGQEQRWIRPIIRVYQSAIPTVNGLFLPSRSGSDEMDEAVPLTTGDLVYGSTDWDRQGRLTIEQSGPFPLTLIGIFGSTQGDLR